MTRIKRIIAEKKETIYQLHKKIGRNRAWIYAICNGETRATGPLRKEISAALGVEEREIFDERGIAKK